MNSIRDRIELTFWAGVLVLSLACVAMAKTSTAPTDQPNDRKGGQSGQEVHSERRSVETGRARVGGQAGEESDQKKTESHTKSRAK